MTKLNDVLRYFYTTRKGNHSATLIPIKEWLVGDAPFPLKSGDSEKKFNYDEYKVDHGLSNEP